jgi:hypothetical protein
VRPQALHLGAIGYGVLLWRQWPPGWLACFNPVERQTSDFMSETEQTPPSFYVKYLT